MVRLLPYRYDRVWPYLANAFVSACGGAAISPQRESELLRQTIAISEMQLELAPSYPLPPADAPLGAALAEAIEAMEPVFSPKAEDAIDKAINGMNLYNDVRRFAMQRLAALEKPASGHGSRLGRSRRTV